MCKTFPQQQFSMYLYNAMIWLCPQSSYAENLIPNAKVLGGGA
jgi:hypothetical protein